jgi:hypothetical protein
MRTQITDIVVHVEVEERYEDTYIVVHIVV